MGAIIWILSLFILCGCEDNKQASQAPQNPSEALTEAPTTVAWKGYAFGDFVDILTPILDPAKLDTLKGKRAAHTPITQGLLLAPDRPYKRL